MSKIYTEKQLSEMTSSAIVELYNSYADKPVKKFADKATAVKRTFAVLPQKVKPTGEAEQAEGKVDALHARVITLLVAENPKRGASAQRYALYRTGMTVGEYLAAGGRSKDINWDVAREYITVA